MEFWGVEVKAGEKLRCAPEFGKLIHISQAAMDEVKDKNVAKGSKNIPLRLTVDDKKYIIGSLAAGERTQVMFDLVLEREFELSHDLKNASVYFIGYVADDPVSDDEIYSDFDDEDEEELPLEPQENGKGTVALDAKPKKENKAAKNGQIAVKKGGNDSDDDSEEDTEFSDDGEMSLDEMSLSDSDGSDGEGEDDESDEEVIEAKPEANQSSKKRQAVAALQAPAVAKKAKQTTPEQQKGKKGQNATPSPSKKSVGKKDKTPKSGAHSKSKNGRKSTC